MSEIKKKKKEKKKKKRRSAKSNSDIFTIDRKAKPDEHKRSK